MSCQRAGDATAASPSASTSLYTVPAKKEERVPFDGPPGYAGAIPAGAAVDGAADTMRTSVDTQLAIQRLSRDVYSEKTSAPREDMANESTSARIAIERHGARPRIRVVLDENTRRFSVQGIDTMGCTWDAFSRALAVIGITTNADPGRAGQMGMGFYANTLLSDTIIFESHSRETGERFTAMCKGGTEWQVGLKSAPMPEFGARVSMTVRPGVDMPSLEQMVRKCARLAPCPVSIEAEDGSGRRDLPAFCCARSLAMEAMYRHAEPYMVRYGYADRGDESACNPVARPGIFVEGMRGNDIDGCLCLHGQKDGVEACAIFVSTYRKVSDGGGKKRVERCLRSKWRETQAYLVGMPITLDYFSRHVGDIDGGDSGKTAGRFRDASILVVRVHDERRYRPTADRERFDADSEGRIVEAVDEILAEQMAAVRWPGTLAGHLRGPYRAAMDMALDSGTTLGSNGSTMELPEVGEREAAMCMAGRIPVRNGFARHSMPLCHAIEAAPRSVLDRSVSASRIMAVARHDPTVRVIVARRLDELSGSGIEAIGDYMERVGIEPLSGDEIAAYEKSEEWRAVRVSYGLPYEDDGRSYGASRCIFYTSAGPALEGAAPLNRDRSRIRTDGLAGVVVARSRLGAIVGAMRASSAPYAVASVGGRGRNMRPDGDGTDLVRGILWPPTDGRDGDDAQPGVRIVSEDDFLAAAAAAAYRTSCGEMTGEDIARHGGRIAVMRYGDDAECERLAAAIGRSAWFGRPGTLYAVCGGDEHFSLLSLLGAAAAAAAAAAGRSRSGDPSAPLSAGRIVRVLALPAIPGGEKKKSMMPAGAPVLLRDEIAGCGGGGAERHAGIAARRVGDWMVQMDLLLASLEIGNADILAAMAGSAPAFSATDRRGAGEGTRLISLLDGAIEAEAALAAAPPAPEPPARHVRDLDRKLVDAGNDLLAGAKKWIARGCQGAELDALRGATMDEAGAHAAGRTYPTNSGPMTGAEIAAGCPAADRIAADIIVYERDAAGLAEALPAAGAGAVRTVAVVPTVDDAVELGCAIAAAGLRCRIGGDGEGGKRNRYARYILQDAVPRKVLAGLELRDKYGSSNWWGFPCAWHGLLTVRNAALRGLLAEALDVYDAGWNEASAFGALVDRFRWLDGQRPCGSGGRGSAGAGRNEDPAAGQAAGHIECMQAPELSGASKRGD